MPRLDLAYLSVATRALDAADAAGGAGVQEQSGFLSYHAFESAGGAYCTKRGGKYPASHQKKIKQFVREARSERFAKATAQLAVEVASLRNRLLYPVERLDGSVDVPEAVITRAQADRLRGRVRALTSRVSAVL